MKQLCIFLTIFLLSFTAFSQIKVGDNVGTISPASLLELESTDQGVLLPRLTTAQRDAQGSWTEGHVIYNTTDSCFQFFDGSIWDCMVGASETIEDNPPGLSIFGNCFTPCENIISDTIQVATLDPVNWTKTFDSTEVKNILNQDKCFIITKMEDGFYNNAVINFEMPSPANYLGKTFSIFIEPNSNISVPVNGQITVSIDAQGRDYVHIINTITTLNHTPGGNGSAPNFISVGGLSAGELSCLRGLQLTAVSENTWTVCLTTVCKD